MLIVAAGTVVGGCAGEPAAPPAWHSHGDMTGSIQPAGYELSAGESGWDCMRLTGAIELGLPELASLAARAQDERHGPPPSLTRAVARIFGGPNDGYPVQAEHARARDRLERYNATLGEHGCDAVDIDARLADITQEKAAKAAVAHDEPLSEPSVYQQAGIVDGIRP